MNDFSPATIRKLNAKGIRLVGLQAIPNMSSDMPFATATRGYKIDDNGCGRVWTFTEVKAAAH